MKSKGFPSSSSLYHTSTLSLEPAESPSSAQATRQSQKIDKNQKRSSSSLQSQNSTTTTSGSTQRKFHSLNQKSPYQLCFLRHGQSTWNRSNRFIGWTDTPLTDDGVLEARVAGQMLHRSGMKFDEVHTSLLRRSIRTANLVLMENSQEYIPVHKHWRLNERHYGNLVGKNKKEIVMSHGKEQVRLWRRSWDVPPPPMADDHEFHPALDPRYRDVSFLYLIFFYAFAVMETKCNKPLDTNFYFFTASYLYSCMYHVIRVLYS